MQFKTTAVTMFTECTCSSDPSLNDEKEETNYAISPDVLCLVELWLGPFCFSSLLFCVYRSLATQNSFHSTIKVLLLVYYNVILIFLR